MPYHPQHPIDRVFDGLDEDYEDGNDQGTNEGADGVWEAESTYTDDDVFVDLIKEYDDSEESQDGGQQVKPEGNLTQRLQAAQEPELAAESSTSSLGKRRHDTSTGDTPRKLRRRLSSDDPDNPFVDNAVDPDEPIIIAHNPRYQLCFEARDLQYGIQYEIARLVSTNVIDYSDILIDVLGQFKGKSNHDGVPRVAQAFKQVTNTVVGDTTFSREKEAKNPWKELDLEEEALKKDPNGCLGFNETNDDWYGGKVNFRGKLKKTSAKGSSPSFKIVLEKAELGPSNRFARKFGSKSFLRIKVTKECLSYEKELVLFFKHPFILNGSVFRAFYEKDKNVFLFMTNEVVEGSKISPQNFRLDRISLIDFLDWHNPITNNINQTMTKWSARFALGLSNSAPGILLEARQIMKIDDVVSSQGSDMTDGAGLANKAALLQLKKKFDWDDWPTAIQCRINGNKGLLYHYPSDDSNEPRIWIRPSQTKIQYPDLEDPTLRIIDVLRSSHARVSCQLSAEVIINLWHNGVPASAFETLLQKGLEDNIVTPLMTWDGPNAMFDLWSTLCKRGGIMTARAARRETSMARVRGYGDRQTEEFDDDDEDGIRQLNNERSTAWWSDERINTSLFQVMYLLDSGFTPKNCMVLKDKLHQVIKSAINNYVRSYRIDVPMSVTAFIVPDQDGELEEGEVFFKSSRRNLIGPDGLETDMILGEVLLTRHPCKLPTDVVKWRCVDKPHLRNRTDVIILPVKGLHRAAEILSGGDYDGDKGVLIFQPELVMPFVNPPFSLSLPPSNLEKDNFETTTNETVAAFLDRIPRELVSAATYIHEVQEFLLRGLTDISVVGAYSNMHDFSAYTRGYSHPETLRLAHMQVFCLVLDGAKTGLKVSPHVLSRDRKENAQKILEWKEFSKDPKEVSADETNAARAKPLAGKKFVMDAIQGYAKKQGEIQLSKVEQKMKACSAFVVDEELTAPWKEAYEVAKRPQSGDRLRDLDAIKKHVQNVYQKHRTQLNNIHGRKNVHASPKKGAAFTDLPIEVRQDELRALSQEFAAKPLPEELVATTSTEATIIKASYAYLYDVEQRASAGTKWTRFPWNVAMRELCAIKTRATGRGKPLNGDFYERMMIKVRR
ncbi:RNA dependent RNA polymerase-domain-containing protein [Desarmillaria tabescens]|uniref:RNA-dependent RNA polymerase n=1 Tax=Armillaria tabescens TaxID=1929756 RepID=A0AA39NMB0_ARMTA|nr:RNA dependent RNA polymerase-domain-containing protein [Desarmillaria tabescens]KAK0468272.1 RNA dependent RNA polymerase-domain-containing protein [Desarmillaria tabescens]